jgi:lipopolysaccharide export system ATP-binding protein
VTAMLRARTLAKQFGSKWAVRDVSLQVGAGEVVGLLGPNGAGKTTSFNMIVGRIRPSQGHVFLGEDEITSLPMYQRARRGITYLPQEASVFRKLTVEDNILAIVETLPLSRADRQQRAAQLLRELGLEAKSRQLGVTLSGGERRRVEITRALVLDPKFMLLDEPFSGIDPIAVLEIQKIVAELRGRGIGIVITDHNVRETLAICDRAYIIQDGQILREGTPHEITEDRAVREIYLGENFRL